jgi:hypothetical protein
MEIARQIWNRSVVVVVFVAACAVSGGIHADEGSAAPEKPSPWLMVPLLTSNPKMDTSVGGLAGYLYQFDQKSTPSMFGASGVYSASDSFFGTLFAQAFFDGDRQRLSAAITSGKVNNNYEDFLETGIPAQTTDNVKAFAARYTHALGSDWFFGGQFLSTNYVIEAEGLWEQTLDTIGLTGMDSAGVGMVIEFDSRNNKRNATSGRRFLIHNNAYRESLGGEENFNVFNGDYSDYRRLSDRYVLATQFKGRWTDDAPKSGHSSVSLKGYVRGMQLKPNYMHLTLDNRIKVKDKWGLVIYGGVGCLYEDIEACDTGGAIYPALGAGVSYLLREKAGIVIRAEYVAGKDDSDGVYLSLGHPY